MRADGFEWGRSGEKLGLVDGLGRGWPRCGGLLTTCRAGDDGDSFELGDGGGGNPESLCIGSGIGREQEEAVAGDEGAVVGSDSFDLISVREAEAEEDTLDAGAPGEGFA